MVAAVLVREFVRRDVHAPDAEIALIPASAPAVALALALVIAIAITVTTRVAYGEAADECPRPVRASRRPMRTCWRCRTAPPHTCTSRASSLLCAMLPSCCASRRARP